MGVIHGPEQSDLRLQQLLLPSVHVLLLDNLYSPHIASLFVHALPDFSEGT